MSDDEVRLKLREFYSRKGVWTAVAQACMDEGRAIDADLRESVMSRVGKVSILSGRDDNSQVHPKQNTRRKNASCLWTATP